MGITGHTNVITVLLDRQIKYTIEASNRLYYVVHTAEIFFCADPVQENNIEIIFQMFSPNSVIKYQ